MDVSTAIMHSIAVPILFTPVKARYIDGSTMEFSPGAPFIGKNDVLEIRASVFVFENKEDHSTSLVNYLNMILRCMLLNRLRYDDCKRINIETNFDIFNFNMNKEDRFQLYLDGYNSAFTSLL
jgi:predicted acylesterase/phospholipase RssA